METIIPDPQKGSDIFLLGNIKNIRMLTIKLQEPSFADKLTRPEVWETEAQKALGKQTGPNRCSHF